MWRLQSQCPVDRLCLTLTTGQFQIAFSQILSGLIENLEPEFSPPVGRLAATGELV